MSRFVAITRLLALGVAASPASALAEYRQAMPSSADNFVTVWLADALNGVGAPDIGLAYLTNLELLGLLAAYGVLATSISVASYFCLRAAGLKLRAGGYVAFLAGLIGVVVYRAELHHPSFGSGANMHLIFGLCAVSGLCVFNLGHMALLRRDAKQVQQARAASHERIERTLHGRGARH